MMTVCCTVRCGGVFDWQRGCEDGQIMLHVESDANMQMIDAKRYMEGGLSEYIRCIQTAGPEDQMQ